MSLYDRIMALPIDKDAHPVERIGFRVARKEAAMIAKEADELMAEMAGALGSVQAYIEDHGGHSVSIEEILGKYNAYKEQSK